MWVKFKNLIWFSAILFALLAVIDAVIGFGAQHSTIKHVGKINKLCNGGAQPEIAIFGSSVAEVGIDALTIQKLTGNTVYNFGIDGTQFIQYKGLIQQFVEHKDQTKVIVMAEAYFSLSNSKRITGMDRYLAQLTNPHVYQSLYNIQPELSWKCRNVPFYKYIAATHTYYLTAIQGWKNVLFPTNQIDSTLGQYKVYRDWEADHDAELRSMSPFKIIIDHKVVSEYEQLVLELEKKGYKVVIILMPIYSEIAEKITDFTPVRQALSSISKHTDAFFLDYTKDSVCLHKTYFYNSNHLNNKGSDYFANSISDTLSSIILNK